jgi:hypothetical protein
MLLKILNTYVENLGYIGNNFDFGKKILLYLREEFGKRFEDNLLLGGNL